MPRKIRELKRDLRGAGFIELAGRGKGSHSVWYHPKVVKNPTLPGKDGQDAKPYEESLIRLAIEEASR